MCWTCKKPIKRIAKKDIEVFKIVYVDADSIVSAIRNFTYELGKKYTSELEEPNVFDAFFVINVGLHSYSNKCTITNKVNEYNIYGPSRKSRCDYHKWLQICGSMYYAQKLVCIIPKEAAYYINNIGEIVSNQLITVRLEDL